MHFLTPLSLTSCAWKPSPSLPKVMCMEAKPSQAKPSKTQVKVKPSAQESFTVSFYRYVSVTESKEAHTIVRVVRFRIIPIQMFCDGWDGDHSIDTHKHTPWDLGVDQLDQQLDQPEHECHRYRSYAMYRTQTFVSRETRCNDAEYERSTGSLIGIGIILNQAK